MTEDHGVQAGRGRPLGGSRSRLAILVLLAVVQYGCAYTRPYVDPFAALPKPEGTQDQGLPSIPDPVRKEMPTTSAAVDAAYLWARDVQKKRADITELHRSLDLATFGLTVGAVAAPIYKAHRDTITALILGAGTSYAGNTLFAPVDLAPLYGGAAKALGCVSAKGRSVLQALPPDPSPVSFDRKFNTDVRPTADKCRGTDETLVNRVQAGYDSARFSLERVLANDVAGGYKVRQAAENVLHALNEEIDKRSPSPEAIVSAARSVGGLVGLALPKQPEAQAVAAKPKPEASGVMQCSEADLNTLRLHAGAYERLQKALDAALDQVDSLETACTFAPSGLPDLALNDDPVVLTQGETYTIRVTGGRKPYRASWQGKPPTGNIDTIPETFMDQLQLKGSDGLKSVAEPFTLLIQDSSAVTRSKTIKVTTKRAS